MFIFINQWYNVLDTFLIYLETKFHIIFTFDFIPNGIYMIFQNVFHCADVVCIPHVNM